MNHDDAEEYTQALGQVVAGGWRQVALGHRLGVPAALGISTTEWVQRRLGGYITLSIGERREAVAELAAEGLTQREIGSILGRDHTTIGRDLVGASAPTSDGDQLVPARTGASAPTDKELAAAETQTRRDVSRNASVLPDAMDYRVGDSREVLASVADCSVNLVLTDPPYGDEAEALYEWLAEWSARVLMPGGSLICYTGQTRLDRDMRIFSGHLRYWWQLVMIHTQAQRLPGKFVIAGFKPVLWYVKEYRRGRTLVVDTLRSRPDLSELAWAQSDGGVATLVETLTEPGELVVDPFAGTGRWGEITAGMGRRWIGCDTTQGGAEEVVV